MAAQSQTFCQDGRKPVDIVRGITQLQVQVDLLQNKQDRKLEESNVKISQLLQVIERDSYL